MALQHFLGIGTETALYFLLVWSWSNGFCSFFLYLNSSYLLQGNLNMNLQDILFFSIDAYLVFWILFSGSTGSAATKHSLPKFAGKGHFFSLYAFMFSSFWIVNLCYLLCSKCGRLLAMDRESSLLLPPVRRPYRHFSPLKVSSTPVTSSTKDQFPGAYHIGCFSEGL